MTVRQIGRCASVGCQSTAFCKGFCERHYRRFKKYGDPMAGKTPNGHPLDFLRAIPSTDECVEWPYSLRGNGYGQVRLDGKMMNAHRAALIIHSGPPDRKDMHAAHAPEICHNRLCVNPRHLRWATAQENMQDRAIDGTQNHPKGEAHGAAKLTTAMVVEMRNSMKSQKDLAKEFGVSRQTVSQIICRKRWQHV